jgi:hypothetical protein
VIDGIPREILRRGAVPLKGIIERNRHVLLLLLPSLPPLPLKLHFRWLARASWVGLLSQLLDAGYFVLSVGQVVKLTLHLLVPTWCTLSHQERSKGLQGLHDLIAFVEELPIDATDVELGIVGQDRSGRFDELIALRTRNGARSPPIPQSSRVTLLKGARGYV